ncbi:MAG: DUF1987 domain-containing protein [Treponema sp.]|nr:DUF1987 domain-containing protein [Treponema sp.]
MNTKAFILEREKTDLTPYVLIDEEKGYMILEGESYHENVIAFYKEISDWLSAYLLSDFNSFAFDCDLKYFSSSTVKVLLNMFLDMDHSKNASKITVNWIVNKKNEIIIECGEDFKEDMKHLIFNIITKDD